uniref:Structural protein VP9 n=1 Tax=Rice ragged stunt virus (isolate Thailand) TaxID=649603 RepID=VP9_RRSVT|nr:RecName: Full=Structural protein VP9 [Rice ragged stunt virus (isolate Thailand)]AAA85466.1 38 kDa spike protein [Rice ragged stunt virus]
MKTAFARDPFTAPATGTYGTIYASRSLPRLSISKFLEDANPEIYELSRYEALGTNRPSSGKRAMQPAVSKPALLETVFTLDIWYRRTNNQNIGNLRDSVSRFLSDDRVREAVMVRLDLDIVVQLKEYWLIVKDKEAQTFADRLAFDSHLFVNRGENANYDLVTQTFIPSDTFLKDNFKTEALKKLLLSVQSHTGLDAGLQGDSSKATYNIGLGQYLEDEALLYRQGVALQQMAFAELELARGAEKEAFPSTFDLSNRPACNLILKRTCKWYQQTFKAEERKEFAKSLWVDDFAEANWNTGNLSFGFSTTLNVIERWRLTRFYVHMYSSVHIYSQKASG